ncbi:MAG: type II toxin-antitoxin system death-on-curing family toxin [Limnochordales bacterium]
MRKDGQIKYLTPEEILGLHEFVMSFTQPDAPQEEGGVRSEHDLLSACFVCQQTFDGVDLYPDLWDKAAALMRSLIQNHPFRNGNKRTAVIVVDTFLKLNYYELAVPDNKLIELTVRIAEKKVTLNKIKRTLWKYSKYNPNGPKSGYLILKYIMNDKEKWSSTKGIGRD